MQRRMTLKRVKSSRERVGFKGSASGFGVGVRQVCAAMVPREKGLSSCGPFRAGSGGAFLADPDADARCRTLRRPCPFLSPLRMVEAEGVGSGAKPQDVCPSSPRQGRLGAILWDRTTLAREPFWAAEGATLDYTTISEHALFSGVISCATVENEKGGAESSQHLAPPLKRKTFRL